MKKRKTYEISVINKTYSKSYSDQTKFYTSDTALELNFQLKEVEYYFDSAEIILLNVDDRSLVTRPVSKSAEGYTYELEDDIVARYGEWKGQLKFNEGGEIYVSSPVSFRIENDLSNDRPPQMTEVNTWKKLRAIADGLIADIRSELDSITTQVSEIEGAETARQQAETQRATAEAQREIDHANRSVELDGKADKVVLNNLNNNGDFSDGLSKWEANNGVVLEQTTDGISFNMDSVTTLYFSADNVVDTKEIKSGDVIYTSFSGIFENNPPFSTTIEFRGSSIVSILSIRHENLGNDFTYSGIYKLNDDLSLSRIRYLYTYRTPSDMEGANILRNVTTLNLTKIFGTGNEPTKEEMDGLIKVTGYIDGEYALNNKELMIWTLALIRRNKNAIITLGGTI